ncbi:MAG TPA: response regulator [Sphingobacteriaceae bacterium]
MNDRRVTVLYVDDDPLMLRIVSRYLENNSFSCRTASTVYDALEQLQFCRPDLILSDYDMPVVNGGMFRRHVLSMEQLKSIPFVYYSGTTSAWFLAEAEELGVHVVSKLAGLDKLLDLLKVLKSRFCREEAAL